MSVSVAPFTRESCVLFNVMLSTEIVLGVTVTVQLAVCPSTVTVIWVCPSFNAVTVFVSEVYPYTDAISVSLTSQLNCWSLAFAGEIVAVSSAVFPSSIERVSGARVTLVTGIKA